MKGLSFHGSHDSRAAPARLLEETAAAVAMCTLESTVEAGQSECAEMLSSTMQLIKPFFLKILHLKVMLPLLTLICPTS